MFTPQHSRHQVEAVVLPIVVVLPTSPLPAPVIATVRPRCFLGCIKTFLPESQKRSYHALIQLKLLCPLDVRLFGSRVP
jgi:hypothetical protein